MNPTIQTYNDSLTTTDKVICDTLAEAICKHLPEAENKIWHAHPVWFLDGNPVVGYSKQKAGIKLLFWSGIDFNEPELKPGSGKFKDASILYTEEGQIVNKDLARWLKKSREMQWDYKNIVKRKGELIKLK